MTGLKASFGAFGLVLAAAGAMAAGSAAAQGSGPEPAPYAEPGNAQAPYAQPDAGARSVQMWAPAGTEVAVQLDEPVGTHETKAGDHFALRLAAPVIVDGQVVMAAGTPGVGRVIQSSAPAPGGKPAKLVLSAEFLTVPGGAVPLQGLQLGGAGKDQSNTAAAASAGGLLFMPLGLLGFAVKGGDVEIPAGTTGSARISQAVPLYPLSSATERDYAAVRAVLEQQTRGWINPPPPPPGMGQVVFFRSPSLIGTAQWFNVRENGQALGKLTNGDYFIATLPPGIHQFTATSEPEIKDALNLKIDAGETYYVEGIMTKGVIIGAADLTPSDKAHFDEASSKLTR